MSTSNNPVADGAGAAAEASDDDPEIGEDVVSLVEQLISMPNPTASQFTAAPVIGFFCSIIDGTTVKASLLAPVELAMRIFFNAAVEVSETPSFLFCLWFDFFRIDEHLSISLRDRLTDELTKVLAAAGLCYSYSTAFPFSLATPLS